ncbi:YeeE/YedE thiosulfate transporter family protein [Allorhodopirellula heiligendammensis]|uniref:Inner membrane protein n=1 Tax=Allorhodopirellula heiligendammensis TaxID=2714739 RepID=A0A5C6BW07_9BACT|nr:YeeE/YedE thiosulfate transporter family protein [Allorhodopirellula heiligendammensis]TWU15827.1 putative inner membrane protein [Allorhodopirellula heiligendammensis]
MKFFESMTMLSDQTQQIPYDGAAWSPYLVGALIGVLSMLTFYLSNKPLGASTAYARIAGLIGNWVAPGHTASLKYFDDKPPKVGWELMLVGGVVIGVFVAAWTGGEWTGRWLPEMWQDRIGPASHLLRIGVACLGGVAMAFGARMAGGCTSGHGISGTLQLAVGSWVSAICFFIGGIVAAMLIYGI